MKETKLHKLFELLFKTPKEKRPRLLIITDEEILRCCGRELDWHQFIKPHGIITHLGLDRGDILDVFSKIEFIVNELISIHIQPQDVGAFNEVLNYISFFIKIKLLNNWGIFDNKLTEKIMRIKEVRNGFAHNWSDSEIKYKSKPIRDNFFNFREDLLSIWKNLINVQQKNQPNINDLIKKFEKK